MVRKTARKPRPRPRARPEGAAGKSRPAQQKAAFRFVASSPRQPAVVVYVHGIGNKPIPRVLKRQWDQALFGIDMGARTRLAYWADIRYPQPLLTAEMESLAIGMPETFYPLPDDDFISESVREIERLAPDEPEAREFARALARRLLSLAKPAKQLRGAQRTRVMRGIKTLELEGKILPDLIRRSAMEWISKIFIRDAAAYLFDEDQRAKIRNRVRALIEPGQGPYLLIGHSLGSVIAHDMLREARASRADVKLFITLGSPLGIEEIQDHLKKPLRVPEPVREWQNFADLLDPVAFDKTLKDEFSPREKVEDQEVVNRDTLRLRGFNPHSATGYLGTQEVQHAVREILGPTFAEPISNFIIARDLAAEMADPTQRLPVLIELEDEPAGASLDEKRDNLVEELKALATRDELQIDPLRRFVAAKLKADELDRLGARYESLRIRRIWRNTEKRALLDKSVQMIQAYTAHRGYGALGRNVAWAVLDTGVKPAHPHFRKYGNIKHQWDCTRPGEAPVADEGLDANGHGTHVAGIIAGAGTGEHEALQGMAPEADLHVYKVLDDDGRGEDAWIIKALDHIAEQNEQAPNLVIHGVNLSLGGPFDPSVYACGHSPICRELRRLWRQGVMVCIAAGNEGYSVINTLEGSQELNLDLSIGDPANLEEAVAVGSVHRDRPHMYGISFFSSRGPTADGRAKPDLVAPGERIVSSNHRFVLSRPATHYVAKSGTSMACPHVSGILAAFLSVRREFIGHPDRVKQILLDHCTDLGRDRYHQGAGMPNLIKMLTET